MGVEVIKVLPTVCGNEYNTSITNGSQALTTVESNTYATITTTGVYPSVSIYSFDLSSVPNDIVILDFKLRIKISGEGSCAWENYYGRWEDIFGGTKSNFSTSIPQVIELSNIQSYTTQDGYATEGELITWNKIVEYNTVDNFRIAIDLSQSPLYIYGAELDLYYVTDDTNPKNKVVLNDTTLIDLTSDTVTASDVDSGVLFHLPDGTTTTGTNTSSSEASTKTATLSTSATSFSITGLTAEPEWFILYYTSITARANPVPLISYDGTTVDAKRMYASRTSSSVRIYDMTDSTMTYSNGTMTLTNTSYNFPAGSYTLVYA